jgi:hypothetical protein
MGQEWYRCIITCAWYALIHISFPLSRYAHKIDGIFCVVYVAPLSIGVRRLVISGEALYITVKDRPPTRADPLLDALTDTLTSDPLSDPTLLYTNPNAPNNNEKVIRSNSDNKDGVPSAGTMAAMDQSALFGTTPTDMNAPSKSSVTLRQTIVKDLFRSNRGESKQ